MTDAELALATHFRIRMRRVGWYVALYTGPRTSDYLCDIGPYGTIQEADEAGEASALIDADKLTTSTGRALT